MIPNIKRRISDGAIVSWGYCDFAAELGTEYTQEAVNENLVPVRNDDGTLSLQ